MHLPVIHHSHPIVPINLRLSEAARSVKLALANLVAFLWTVWNADIVVKEALSKCKGHFQ